MMTNKLKLFWRLQKNKMNTKTTKTVLSNLQIETVRKNIKNIHLGVYPPDGRVRVSVPLKTNEEALRLFFNLKDGLDQKAKNKVFTTEEADKTRICLW